MTPAEEGGSKREKIELKNEQLGLNYCVAPLGQMGTLVDLFDMAWDRIGASSLTQALLSLVQALSQFCAFTSLRVCEMKLCIDPANFLLCFIVFFVERPALYVVV